MTTLHLLLNPGYHTHSTRLPPAPVAPPCTPNEAP